MNTKSPDEPDRPLAPVDPEPTLIARPAWDETASSANPLFDFGAEQSESRTATPTQSAATAGGPLRAVSPMPRGTARPAGMLALGEPAPARLGSLSPPIEDASPRGRASLAWAVASVACVIALALAAKTWLDAGGGRQSSRDTGELTVSSHPSEAEVTIDGVARGRTPLTVALSPGNHELELTSGSGKRTLPFVVEAGMRLSHYIEFAAERPAAATGRMEVASEPAGAEVRVDGSLHGITPLTVEGLQEGEHDVLLTRGTASATRKVVVVSGGTATLLVSLPPGNRATAGWVSLRAPFGMEVFEGGRLIGNTANDRLMLPVGPHTLEVVSEPFAFREAVQVQIAAGQIVSRAIQVPSGSIAVDALPWAEVFVDGQSAGVTPLASMTLPIGPHEIVFRHPQYGERRQTVAVTTTTPARLAIDFLN